MRLITKICIGVEILIMACFFIVYGPFDYARDFWITTSMNTMDHKYLAHIFYNQKTIDKSLNENYFVTLSDNTDVSAVSTDIPKADGNYSSIYEEQILDREEDALYKLIEFKYKKFKCYIVAIYDPTRVHAVLANPGSSRGKILSDITKEHNAILGVNGGGYSWANGYPTGYVISHGETLITGSTGYTTAGITEDGVLMVGNFSIEQINEYKIKEALSFSPALIVNGNPIEIIGTGGSGQNPRTVIAQRKDGILFFLIVDGYRALGLSGRGGLYLNDLLVILERYGAYNAMNLDGGSSTTLVINNELVNAPCEPQKEGQDFIRSAWILE